jgi:hypothetical protein
MRVGLSSRPGPAVAPNPADDDADLIVHLIGNGLAFVSRKDRKAILPAIKAIYRAKTADMAPLRLEEFGAEAALSRHQEGRPALAPRDRMNWGQFAIQFGERFPGTTRSTDITAQSMIAWRPEWPSRGTYPTSPRP